MRCKSIPIIQTTCASQSRGGFVSLEMAAIALFGLVFTASLFPTQNFFQTSKDSQVLLEIKNLEVGASMFKLQFGIAPPSRIRLYEAATGSPSWESHEGDFEEPITGKMKSNDEERTRSIALIKRIWPRFDFKLPRDLNNDGDTEDVVTLHGAECLVFFLGGRAIRRDEKYVLTGFSKNPTNPFAPAADQKEPRDGPFVEFQSNRLKPSLNPASLGAPVFMDPHPKQSAPYLYVSSYDNEGYQRADLLVNSKDDLANVYRQGTADDSPPQKPEDCQIISPGADGFYGVGGAFDVKAKSNGLIDRRDDDNITNFHNGRLSSKAK